MPTICFNTASGMDCMQCKTDEERPESDAFQYRKRYGLHAIYRSFIPRLTLISFQYRKRYGLHAISPSDLFMRLTAHVSIPQAVWIACNTLLLPTCSVEESFNTASGMDCMQSFPMLMERWRWKFQYRKRYGLHAMKRMIFNDHPDYSFNTASGMDCMQWQDSTNSRRRASCFNTASGRDCMQWLSLS